MTKSITLPTTKLETYSVTMQKGTKIWNVNTEANSKFNAMLQMTMKYGCGAMAIDAKVNDKCEWSTDV